MRTLRLRNTVNAIQTTISSSSTTTTTTTTTLMPGITQSSGLQHLDILSRYSRFYLLIEQFSPIINNLDRYISPLWIPIGLIGCILCIIIYANPQWRKSLRQDKEIIMNPYGYGSLSIYLLILSILHFIQCILVIIMDLDTPWDTGLLALNSLICPFIHCIWTGNRLAIVLITITLGIETLVLLQRETNFPSNIILRWIIADGNHRKSIRISIGVILLAGIYGLIEIAYWRIQYYNVEYEIIHSANQLSSLSSSSLTLLKSLEPLARCEVAGGFQYWFSMKSIHRYDIFTEMDITKKTKELAASYFDYQWITGIIIDCTFALINICLGLAIIRNYFMDDIIIRPRYAESRATITRRNQFEVLHIAIINIIQGLCRLPNALFTMIDPLTRPGDMNLTDSEVLKDNTWQRFFLMLSAKVIGIELGDLIAALLMPICIGFCQEFRQNFYGLLKFNTPKLLKTTLLSLNTRQSRSRIITPTNSNLPNDSIQNVHGKMTKKPPSHQHPPPPHPHPHHHQQQQHHDDTGNNFKQYHDSSSRLINQLENHNKNINDLSEDSTTERYISNCHFHKLHNEETNTEIQNETDIETPYDNTNHYHHDYDHNHCDHHLHQHDLNSSLKQYPTNLHSNKQNSLYIKPVKYEYHKQSNINLHDSIPNSLFCSYNKLSTQYCNHSMPNSLTNLYDDGMDCDQVHMDKVKPLLEHRSYV
ncbi:unnamed protein product [Schistosoma curassoni]|nr:unnamed protein product [Schistosoma curassoni]